MEISLSPVEARILGVLIEKQLTTPDYYPLTLNALVNACNQKTNRDPVMDLDEAAVTEALDRLRSTRLVWQIKTHGSRALKYEHNMKDAAGFSKRELALICELLLRGPQTAGELRTRTARMTDFAGVPAVEYAMKKLEEHEQGPFVKQLPRQPGQKEPRYVHLMGDTDASAPDLTTKMETPRRRHEPERIESLETRVLSLEAEIEDLRKAFLEFKQAFE